MVCLERASQTVAKSPHEEANENLIAIEGRIYERFQHHGGHPGLLFVNKATVSTGQRLRWAIQIAKALSFIHRVGAIHGDLTCKNIFLDASLNAKVADFSGSSVDRSPLLVVVAATHAYPKEKPSIKGDLFALGSVLYELITGIVPDSGLSEEAIETRYLKGELPDTSSLGAVGSIIRNCWQGKCDDADLVIRNLRVSWLFQAGFAPRSPLGLRGPVFAPGSFIYQKNEALVEGDALIIRSSPAY